MLSESYNNIATFLMNTFGGNFILLTIVITTAVSIAYFVVISYFIVKMDKEYFLRKQLSDTDTSLVPHTTLMNSSVSSVVRITKIIFGVFLVVCGIVMLALPGQGLITMVIGLSLIPFPGKNKIEQNLLSRKSVRTSLNWIRIKANKEPFIFD